MRKLVFLLLLISTHCLGQVSITFVDTLAGWQVARTYPNGNAQHPDFIETTTKIYGFKGDTLMGSALWTKMFFTRDSAWSSSSTIIKAGYVRRENNVVLYADTLFHTDTLYNFNLQVGDSVNYDFGYKTSFIKISSIDSLNIGGYFYKRFFFTEPGGPNAFTSLKEIWIEGIGSIHGPLFPVKPVEFSTEIPDSMNVTCYKVEDTVLWYNSNYNECYINIVLSVNEPQEPGDKIYILPNPVTSELKVITPQNIPDVFVLSIINPEGVKVFNQKYRGHEISVDVRMLKDGVYLLRLESGSFKCISKFIKQ